MNGLPLVLVIFGVMMWARDVAKPWSFGHVCLIILMAVVYLTEADSGLNDDWGLCFRRASL